MSSIDLIDALEHAGIKREDAKDITVKVQELVKGDSATKLDVTQAVSELKEAINASRWSMTIFFIPLIIALFVLNGAALYIFRH